MERLRVNKFISIDTNSTIYIVIEQPGDATRYNHLIYVERDRISCIGFKYDWGAILKNELSFNRDYIMREELNLLGIEPHKAVSIVAEQFGEYEINKDDNLFTTASAIRCMQEILTNYE